MLSHGELLTLVRFVLSAMPVHMLIVMALNSTILKKINRVICDFLWHGCRESRGGHCLVN